MSCKSIIFSIDERSEILDNVMSELNLARDFGVTSFEKGKANIRKFSDGELCVDYDSSVRNKRVYLLSSPNDGDEVMKLCLAIDAAKRASAKEIIPIIPYFPYARQDKKDQARGPIGAKMVAKFIETAGATAIITIDLHAAQIQGFFEIPVTHLEGQYFFAEYIRKVQEKEGDVVLCAPDAGAAPRVKNFKKRLISKYGINLPYVVIDKTREKPNEVGQMDLIGDVEGKNVILIDDMCDTAGTLCKAVDKLYDEGANSVRAMVTHGVLSGPAFKRIANSKLQNFVCSDTLPIPKTVNIESKDREEVVEVPTENVVYVITCASQIALAIKSIDFNISMESLKVK